jgi:hypothetical protein
VFESNSDPACCEVPPNDAKGKPNDAKINAFVYTSVCLRVCVYVVMHVVVHACAVVHAPKEVCGVFPSNMWGDDM